MNDQLLNFSAKTLIHHPKPKKIESLNVYSQAFITAYHVTIVMLKITEKKKLR